MARGGLGLAGGDRFESESQVRQLIVSGMDQGQANDCDAPVRPFCLIMKMLKVSGDGLLGLGQGVSHGLGPS